MGMLGIPEFGTNFVRGMVEETHPTTFAELLQLSGLSPAADVAFGNTQDLIKGERADLSTVIEFGRHHGFTSYTGLKPKMAFTIMGACGKGCGSRSQKKSYKWLYPSHEGKQCSEWLHRICGKIKYMFPKAARRPML